MGRNILSKKTTVLTVAAILALLTAGLGQRAACADVDIDVGRGPVTVHVPPGYDSSQPAPLVVLLHGYGASGQLQEYYMQLLPWSDRLGFLYMYPDGTEDPAGDRFWNATDDCCDYYGTGVDDSAYLRTLIDATIDELNVDTERVFLLGHSNGGYMAYRMACDHADLVAAVASLAGATWSDPNRCTPVAPVRTLQIHGTADDSVLYEGGSHAAAYPGAVETTEQWAAFNNCSVVPDLSAPPLDLDIDLPGFETTAARYAEGCDPGGGAELWTIADGGHIPDLSPDFVPEVLDFFFGDLLTHRYFIPAAAYAEGAEGAFFQTDIDVTNTGNTAARYRFLWLARGQRNDDPPASDEFALGPGMGVRYANAVHEVFGLEADALGAIAVEASSPDVLFASRTYNLAADEGGGTFGQAMPAVPEREMIQGGQQWRVVFASEGARYRTNIGCVNGARKATAIDLELFDQQGNSLEKRYLLLFAWESDQLNRVFEDYSPVDGSVELTSIDPNARYFCYGSIIDNVTNDPTTILPMRVGD